MIFTDSLIVGAGPIGLFQVFELGLLDIKAHIVDSMPRVGGQCTELYPDKPIYDIPALPVCGAQELIDRLQEQIAPFEPIYHLGQEVTHLVPNIDGSFYVKTSTDTEFHARSVIIAGGVGSFQPRRLRVPGIAGLEGRLVNYKVRDAHGFDGKDIVILGGGDSALDWTLDLYQRANSVLLIHRSQDFRAAPASVSRMRELCDAFEMQFLQGDVVEVHSEGARLDRIEVRGSDGVVRVLDADEMLVFFGLSPKLGPIAEWQLQLERKQLVVNTENFQTNVAGVFAVGDINTYPGKKKLILSGFHEAALAAFGVHAHLFPDTKAHLQYTTHQPQDARAIGPQGGELRQPKPRFGV